LTVRSPGDPGLEVIPAFYAMGLPMFSFISAHKMPVFQKLISPLQELLRNNHYSRSCPILTDLDWIETGVHRVISESTTGRGFLQKLGYMGRKISVSLFFQSLRSKRRLSHLKHCLGLLLGSMKERRKDQDPFRDYKELDNFEIYFGDGHFHQHASHDPKIGGKHRATEHFFALNARTNGMSHLTLAKIGGDVKREHDISAIKREGIEALRQAARRGAHGKKVLYVWDRACIDHEMWEKFKMEGGIYFITRTKQGMQLTVEKANDFDPEDPVNTGVLSDQMVTTKTSQHSLRRITYHCSIRNQTFRFITNLPKSIRPGLAAYLYRMRWDIEKVFDEVKNRMNEKKSWSTHKNGKIAQALFICITHNLMTLLEDEAEKEGIKNDQDIKRKEQRLEESIKKRKLRPDQVSIMERTSHRCAQITTIFIRWFRGVFSLGASWVEAMELLRGDYERFFR